MLRRAATECRSRSGNRHATRLAQFSVLALFATGLRISELTSIRLGDVSVREGSIQVRGKGDRERRVYMSGPSAVQTLATFVIARRRIASESDALLVHPNGRRVTAEHLRRVLRGLGMRAGLTRRITPHMPRHTTATQLLEAGVDIRFVQRLPGHRIATTQIYTHVSDRALRTRLAKAGILSRLASWRAG